MPKRSCPFPSTGQPLKTHVDIRRVGKEDYKKQVYIKTSQLLNQGAKDALKNKSKETKGKRNIGPVFGRKLKEKCSGCNQSNENLMETTCAFCDRSTCSNCCRTCCSCGGAFCQVCSVLNGQ